MLNLVLSIIAQTYLCVRNDAAYINIHVRSLYAVYLLIFWQFGRLASLILNLKLRFREIFKRSNNANLFQNQAQV